MPRLVIGSAEATRMDERRTQIGLVLYPGLTQLDLTGPFEVLARIPEVAVGAAVSAREITGAIRPPVAGRLIGDPVAVARSAIGDAAVDLALAEGRDGPGCRDRACPRGFLTDLD